MGRMKAVRSESRRGCHTSLSMVEKGCHRAVIGMETKRGSRTIGVGTLFQEVNREEIEEVNAELVASLWKSLREKRKFIPLD